MKIKIDLLNAKLKASKVKGKHINKVIDGFFDTLKKDEEFNIIINSTVQKNDQTAREIKEVIEEKKVKTLDTSTKENDVRTRENGEKLYKTNYECPNCQRQSHRYASQKRNYVKCHQCHTKLKIVSAVPGNKERGKDPQANEDGAYFLAKDLYK